MANPMELYEVDEQLQGNQSVNKLLEFLKIYYVIQKEDPAFHVQTAEEPRIVIRGGSRGIEFWPKEGPVRDVVFGNPSGLEELLRKGILKPRFKFFTHDSYDNKPRISFEISDESGKLRKYGLDKAMIFGWDISIYLEPIK